MRSLISGCLSLLTIFLCSRVYAQSDSSPRPRHVTVETRSAIDDGLSWLAKRQQPSGAYGSVEDYAHNVGITALCGMAFLSSGNVPERGPYLRELSRCVDFLIECSGPNGFIVEADAKTHGPMYGHGFATLFLSQVYGMSPRPEIRDNLQRAVRLILSSQNSAGGWRYFPVPDDADISVTVCQMMALRAARDAGVAVPKQTIDAAVKYVRECQNLDGGFRYRLFDPAESRLPRSAAAVVSLFTSGIHDDPALTRGLAYLHTQALRRTPRQEYYYYGQYYAALAAWHAGDAEWDQWYPAARDELLRLRKPAGNWSDPYLGDEYATALSLIVLQVPYDYVPIFER